MVKNTAFCAGSLGLGCRAGQLGDSVAIVAVFLLSCVFHALSREGGLTTLYTFIWRNAANSL